MAWVILWASFGLSAVIASEPPQIPLTPYPTAGVAFRGPSGWVEQVRDKGKTIAWWIAPDSRPGKPTAIIMVECAKPVDSSLDEAARGLARGFHGEVDGRPTSMGGTRALRIVAKNGGPSLRPVEALAAMHEGRLYLVMGGVTAGHSVKEELESIRASWTWTQIEPPFRHLELRDKPFSLAQGAATIQLPELMYTYPHEEPDRVLDLGLHNFTRNAPDFLAYVQVVPLPTVLDFEAYRGQLSDRLQAQGIVKKPIVWRKLEGDPDRLVSETMQAEVPDGTRGRKQSTNIRWAVVRIDDRRLVSVNFTLPVDAPGDRETYVRLADRIVETIRPGPAAQPGPRKPGPAGTGR